MNRLQSTQAWLMSVLLLVSVNTMAMTNNQSWNFSVFLGDTLIGHHTFNVYKQGNTRYISTQATFNVRVLFFNAYHYYHEDNEVWDGQCLKSIHAITNDNGEIENVTGNQDNGALTLKLPHGTRSLPGCTRTFSYWDPVILKSKQLLNSQTGELLEVKTQDLGNDKIKVRNRQVSARHYRLITPKFSIELWYSKSGQWLALQSTTSSGKMLHYKLQ